MASPHPSSHGYPPPQQGYPPRGDDRAMVPYSGPPPGGYGPPGAYGPAPPHYAGYPPPQPGYGPPPVHYGYPPPGHYGPPPPGYSAYPPHPHMPPPGYPGYGYPPPPPHYGPYGYPPPHPYYGALVGRSRSRSPRGGRRGGGGQDGSKYTCRFFIGIENDDEFRVARRIIGANGSKMKDIVAKSGGEAKLRLRGKGSGYIERDTNQESPEPLQLCISCPTQEGYYTAMKCTEELLLRVYGEYDSWCAEKGKPERAPRIHMTEKHHAGEVPSRARGDTPGSGNGSGGGRRRGGKARKKAGGSKAEGSEGGASAGTGTPIERGKPPTGAPPVEEIERLINDRNNARRRNDFSKADAVRDDLKARGVVLSDEKGGHGNGLMVASLGSPMVTQWRYWHE